MTNTTFLTSALDSSSIPSVFVASCVSFQLRPLPSTGITRLRQYCGPLRHPIRPGLALASCQLIPTAITAGASRVAPDPLCRHAVATTPAGPMEPIRSLLSHQLRPSPDYSWVGSCINSFEACLAFTRVTTCRLTKSPYATLYTGGSGGFVVSTAAPIVTGWSDPVPGRVLSPAVDQRLFTAHCNRLITTVILKLAIHVCGSDFSSD